MGGKYAATSVEVKSLTVPSHGSSTLKKLFGRNTDQVAKERGEKSKTDLNQPTIAAMPVEPAIGEKSLTYQAVKTNV